MRALQRILLYAAPQKMRRPGVRTSGRLTSEPDRQPVNGRRDFSVGFLRLRFISPIKRRARFHSRGRHLAA